MKRIMILYTNFIPNFVVGKGIAKFAYLTSGTNGAMFTYLTQGTNRIKYYSTKKSYSKEMGIIYTNFIKALLHNRLNLDSTRFKKRAEIIDFLEGFQGDKLFTRHHITTLKNQGEFERVPLTPKSKEFINYVKATFNDFDGFEFALVKPITKEEGKLVTTKHESKIEPVKIVSGAIPTVIQKESTVVSSNATPTVTETITKRVEPIVTETIVKMVEPVAKVVEPVVKVVETITKPITDAIPNIIINNANTNSAHATTVTSNSQVASSSWDTLFGLFGLNKIFKLIKEIFGWDGDGIIYLLIQLPYLVLFLLTFKDNPDIMKYLTDTFGIEEYKAPNTELAPIEYDFAPIDFDSEDNSNNLDAYEEDLGEEVYRDYTNNSDIEYFDYFDYYHSKDNDETIPTSKEVVEDLKELKEELKDVGNNLLDTTKHAIGTSSESIKDKINTFKDNIQSFKPEIDAINKNKFLNSYVAIDGFSVTDNYLSGALDTTKVSKFRRDNSNNGTSLGGILKWLFPMLDFDSLYYHPSYFEKFNVGSNDFKAQPTNIIDKVEHIKMLINELNYTLNLNKVELPRILDINKVKLPKVLDLSKIEVPKFNLPKIRFNIPDIFSNQALGKGIQSHADTLSILEGVTPNTKRTPNWRNTSLISDNTTFSTYYNRSWNKPRDILLARIPSVNSDISGWMDPPRLDDARTPMTPSLIIDTDFTSLNRRPIRPVSLGSLDSEYFDNEIASSNNAVATIQDTKRGIHDLLNIKTAIVEVDSKIVKIKDQFIDYHHKINRFNEQIADLTKQKIQFTEKSNIHGKLSYWDKSSLKKVLQQLDYIDQAKASLEASNTLSNDELKNLEMRKASLVELKNKYEKDLGNIATTPNV